MAPLRIHSHVTEERSRVSKAKKQVYAPVSLPYAYVRSGLVEFPLKATCTSPLSGTGTGRGHHQGTAKALGISRR